MAIAGSSTAAYVYTPRLTEDGRTVVEQRKTTTTAALCATVDEATAALLVLKPTMVAGNHAVAVNEFIRAQGWRMVAVL
jgi:hypothetical protein